jgi:hypothetical protein
MVAMTECQTMLLCFRITAYMFAARVFQATCVYEYDAQGL